MCIATTRIISNIFILFRNVSTKIFRRKKVISKSIKVSFFISRTFARVIAWCRLICISNCYVCRMSMYVSLYVG